MQEQQKCLKWTADYHARHLGGGQLPSPPMHRAAPSFGGVTVSEIEKKDKKAYFLPKSWQNQTENAHFRGSWCRFSISASKKFCLQRYFSFLTTLSRNFGWPVSKNLQADAPLKQNLGQLPPQAKYLGSCPPSQIWNGVPANYPALFFEIQNLSQSLITQVIWNFCISLNFKII